LERRYHTKEEEKMSRQSDLDNYSNQMNPNNDAYWESRGYDERPDDWEDRPAEDKDKSGDKQSYKSKH
jgi:hypothetical protein